LAREQYGKKATTLNKAWHIMSAPDLPPNTALKSPKRILSD
jgi:hypothetical protein